eukprot:85143_1
MTQKRTFTEMNSSEVLSDSSDDQPASKRRKLNRLPLTDTPNTTTTLKLNINIPNQNHPQHRNNAQVFPSNTRNLRTNRVTTKAQCLDINIKNTVDYEQLKQRILNQIPSPITSPECAPSIMPNTPIQQPSSAIQIPFEDNQNEIQSHVNNTKRRLRFDLNDKSSMNATHSIQPTMDTSTAKTVVAQSPVRVADTSVPVSHHTRRQAFRTYVLKHLNEDKERIQWICMIFMISFAFWSVFNLFYFDYYDAMHVLVATLVILMIVNDMSECRGECGVYLMMFCGFLIEVFMEFIMALCSKENRIEFDMKLINNELAYVLLMIMTYAFVCDKEYLIQTVIERIFNRGMETRFVSYFMYFWFNASMVTKLISFLYDIKQNTYLLTSYVNLSVLSVYITIVSVIWFKLQRTKFIDVEQFKVNEMFGFIAMIVTHYGLFCGAVNDKNVHQPYLLLVFIALSVFNKLFQF